MKVTLIAKTHANALVPAMYEEGITYEAFCRGPNPITVKEDLLSFMEVFLLKFESMGLDATIRVYPTPEHPNLWPLEYKFDEAMKVVEFMEYAYES